MDDFNSILYLYSRSKCQYEAEDRAVALIVEQQFNSDKNFNAKELLLKNIDQLFPDISMIKCNELRQAIQKEQKRLIKESYNDIWDKSCTTIGALYLGIKIMQDYMDQHPEQDEFTYSDVEAFSDGRRDGTPLFSLIWHFIGGWQRIIKQELDLADINDGGGRYYYWERVFVRKKEAK